MAKPTADASPGFWREQASRLRKLAREIVDEQGQRELLKLAEEYEIRALEAPSGEDPGGCPPAPN